MGIAQAHDEVAPERVPLALLEAVHHPGGDPEAPQHDGEGGREILAVPGAADEEELVERIELGDLLEGQGVAELP